MTDGGYTQTEAWNLQLQARVDRLEKAGQQMWHHLAQHNVPAAADLNGWHDTFFPDEKEFWDE